MNNIKVKSYKFLMLKVGPLQGRCYDTGESNKIFNQIPDMKIKRIKS